MSRRILLLRHAAVAACWQGRCYGASEAGLAAAGIAASHRLAAQVPPGFTAVHASPRRRARLLGALVARRFGLALRTDARLAERDFGGWEGMTWDAIYAAEGNAMDGMIDAPDSFRPGGGETTAELAARVLRWFHALPPEGDVAAASHGGPIAALVGSLRGEAARDWLAHVPRPGEGVLLLSDGRALPWRRDEAGMMVGAAGFEPTTPSPPD